MLGRRRRFLEEKGLTAVVFTSKDAWDAWMTAGVAALCLMPMTTRGHIFSFFGMFATHTQTLNAMFV